MTSRPYRLLPALLASLALGGCAALGSVNNAARNLDAYELNPLPVASAAAVWAAVSSPVTVIVVGEPPTGRCSTCAPDWPVLSVGRGAHKKDTSPAS